MKIGEIQDSAEIPLHAWIDKMPRPPNGVHVVGMITAPTPCHKTTTTRESDGKSNPPVYRVKVELKKLDGNSLCLQVNANIPFDFHDNNATAPYEQIEVFSEFDSKTKTLDIVQ